MECSRPALECKGALIHMARLRFVNFKKTNTELHGVLNSLSVQHVRTTIF